MSVSSSDSDIDPGDIIIELDVGGKNFRTNGETLLNFPNTRLGLVASEALKLGNRYVHVFYDRNPKIIKSLLDFYRTGEMHAPKNVCVEVLEKELKFWNISLEMMHECCWKDIKAHRYKKNIIEMIDNFLTDPLNTEDKNTLSLRSRQIWLVLEHTRYSTISKMYTPFYFFLVLLSVVLYALHTSMEYRVPREKYRDEFENTTLPLRRLILSQPVPWLSISSWIIFFFFTIELVLRALTCPDFTDFRKQFKNCFDFFLVLQQAITLIVENVWEPPHNNVPLMEFYLIFSRLALLRVFRVFYMARSIDTMKVLILATRSSMSKMALLVLCTLTLVALFGAVAYVVEVVGDKDSLKDAGHGMWWAIVTMTTVGYGDVVPQSHFGKIVAVMCSLAGVTVLALPVAVFSDNFLTYHTSMELRKQMQRRIKFLAENPQFRALPHQRLTRRT